MNELDQFIKHELKVKSYVRYTDDFIVVSPNKEYLQGLLPKIRKFLWNTLHLELHPNKISIQTVGQGVDFLGYVLFPHHRLLRSETKRRIFRKLKRQMNSYHQGKVNEYSLEQSLQSYLGVLSHANTHKLGEELKNQYWFQK